MRFINNRSKITKNFENHNFEYSKYDFENMRFKLKKPESAFCGQEFQKKFFEYSKYDFENMGFKNQKSDF